MHSCTIEVTVSTIETFTGQRIKWIERKSKMKSLQVGQRVKSNWLIEYFARHIVALVSHVTKGTVE